jgi:hypothetical protein
MLKGTLDDFTLPDIFRLMSLSKKTGSLAVERSAGQGKVYFRDGEVYFAESSLSKERLGEKLVRMKKITESQLRKALDVNAESKKRIGQVLLDEGVINDDDIMDAVRAQIEDAAFDLLRWELGEFLWEPGVEIEPEVPIFVTVENLIMEASRRLDELEVIQRKIPSTETVLAMAANPPQGAVEINISPEEWRILVLVNGQRTVTEIAEAMDMDDFGAMKTLYGLVSTGLIEVPGHASEYIEEEMEEEEEPATAEAEPEQVEAVPEETPAAEATPEPQPEPVAVVEAVPEPEQVAQQESEVPVEQFDAPAPGDLIAQVPDEMPTDAELAAEMGLAPAAEESTPQEQVAPPSPEPVAAAEDGASDIPVSSEPSGEAPQVDRIAAVRELAGLFNESEEEDGGSHRAFRPSESPEAPEVPGEDNKKRVEDDDQVTRGLISRLIDGVKGL